MSGPETCGVCWASHRCKLSLRHDGDHACIDDDDGEPILVFPDPDDPEYVYMSRCILCGLPPTEHTEEACDAKMKAWKPRGVLALLGDLPVSPLDEPTGGEV